MAAKYRKLYLSGKITGDPEYQLKFRDAAYALMRRGYGVCNPALRGSESLSWKENMKRVVALMLKCDGVALIPDWAESKGAGIEKDLALNVGIPVKPLDEWLAAGRKKGNG
jgi:hypothetical protein